MPIIGHLDMDAFFAAVEERDHPELKGLPLAVGADPQGGHGRGVVATANYAARRYGLHSAMPINTAWRLSEQARRRGLPPVVFLRGSHRRYGEVSGRIMAILREFSPKVEEASIDEAYFDLSAAGEYGRAAAICRQIKAAIRARERLTASIGIGPNRLIAKIASDFQKPDGLTVVAEAEAEAFLAPLPVRKIPGIGPKSEAYLAKLGIKKVEDLRRFSQKELQDMFGKWGLALYDRVRGLASAELVEEYEVKSVGEQETFGRDTLDLNFIFERLWQMCGEVWRRLKGEGFVSYRTVVVTVRFADFDTRSRSHTLSKPSDSPRTLRAEAMKLLLPFLDSRENPKHKLIRLIGARVEKLGKD